MFLHAQGSKCNLLLRTKVIKPALKVHGAWAQGPLDNCFFTVLALECELCTWQCHLVFVCGVALSVGWCLDLYVLDECTMHDGSAICEMLAMTLERVHAIALETGRTFPRTVLLASDNTVREAKNKICLLTLANLTAKYNCRVTGLINLRKSHSHDKLDQ